MPRCNRFHFKKALGGVVWGEMAISFIGAIALYLFGTAEGDGWGGG